MTEQTQEKPSWYHPEYPPISNADDVGKAAVEGQLITYPQVVRKNSDPPIQNQVFGNVSFMLFDTPRRFRGKPIYGYVKLRGNHADADSARYDAYRIVRQVDSKFQVRTAPVGHWVPITDNDSGVVEELYDVRENDEEHHIRDEAVKEREREARRIAKELKEGEEKLKSGDDIYDKPESLDFYTMKRVTEMKLSEAISIQKRKLQEVELQLAETHILCRKLEKTNPEYAEQWIENYNKERVKTSLVEFVPSENQFSEYDSTTLEELETKFPELVKVVDGKLETYGKTEEDQEEEK